MPAHNTPDVIKTRRAADWYFKNFIAGSEVFTLNLFYNN